MQFSFLFLGFLTLPTAYVTGNPVECVLHPDLWNKTELFDMSSGTVGKISSRMLEPDREDQYDEENYGYSVDSVRLIVKLMSQTTLQHCKIVPKSFSRLRI